MKKGMIFILVSIFLLGACSTKSNDGTVYGEAPTMNKSVSVAELLSDPGQFNQKEVLVSGTIAELCQEKGCWLSMENNGQTVMVRFKDYGFFVPKDAGGKPVKIQGIFHAENLKHVCPDGEHKEGGACKEHDSASFSMIASGVVIKT